MDEFGLEFDRWEIEEVAEVEEEEAGGGGREEGLEEVKPGSSVRLRRSKLLDLFAP